MLIAAISLVPVLMFADYFLTIFGAIQREKKYSQHVKTQHYELNPTWQQQVGQKKWINPRHIGVTFLVFAGLLYLLGFGTLPEYLVQATLGCILTVYGLIVGRHLGNLLLFGYVIQKPDTISGEVTMSHQLVTAMSVYQYLVAIIPLMLIAIFSRGWFAYGSVVGAIALSIVHFRWLQKTTRQKQ